MTSLHTRPIRGLPIGAVVLCILFMPRTECFAQSIGEALDAYGREIEELGFSGTILAVRNDEVVLAKGYGLADRARRIENSPETIFEIASLSKQFTAAAILRLEQEGRLSTDDPIAQYLPGVPEAYLSVTIYDVLTHMGGLPAGGPGRGLDLEEAVRSHLGQPPISAPGKRYAYSNVGYALLAGIVERASGKPFEAYCREVLFEPAGMNDTGFCGEGFPESRLALGYSGGEGPGRAPDVDPYAPHDAFGFEYRGMGGVLTTVHDLRRWIVALRDDRVLNEAARTKLFERRSEHYACGWEVFEFPDGRRCVGHGGSVRGFVCKLWSFPDDEALLVVLSNRDDFNYAWLNGMYGILFEDPRRGGGAAARPPGVTSRPPRPPRPPALAAPPVVPATDAELDRLSGEYVATGSVPFRLTIRRSHDGLDAGIAPPAASPHDDGTHAKLRATALEIIQGLANDDVDPLADHLAPGIPPTWPDIVRTRLWPEQIERRGILENATVLGADPMPRAGGLVIVWLLLEYTDGESMCLMGFRSERLQLLMLDLADIYGATAPNDLYLKRQAGAFMKTSGRTLPVTLAPSGDDGVQLAQGMLRLVFRPAE